MKTVGNDVSDHSNPIGWRAIAGGLIVAIVGGLLAQRFNNGDIARQLHISQKTVRNHCSNIFSKLQVVDRAQAIIRAREAGIGRTGT